MQTSFRHARLLTSLGTIVIGMFLFAVFVMPPIYDAFCEATGLNGKPSGKPAAAINVEPQTERVLDIQFLAQTGNGMPWRFAPNQKSMRVYPGEIKMAIFTAENLTDNLVTSNAIPSISPPQATQYFKKTQCFCFERQTLEGRSKKEMPVIFYVDPALPKDIGTITLSYTLYNVDDLAQNTQPIF